MTCHQLPLQTRGRALVITASLCSWSVASGNDGMALQLVLVMFICRAVYCVVVWFAWGHCGVCSGCNLATSELVYLLADDIFGGVLEKNISQGLTEAARGMVLTAVTVSLMY